MRALVVAVLIVAANLSWAQPVPAQAIRELFKRVAPSVAVIRATGRDVSTGGLVQFNETGSGVLISSDGKVMTAAHVVHAMDTITVEFLGGETVTAHVVASEPQADLSLLQLSRVPPGVRVSPLANSDTVQVGDQVIVVGAPYGLSYSLSVGYISARWAPNTVYKTMPLAEFFQTDATINTGNSGGPLFNMAGEVIGLVSHNISKGGGSEGLGFVVTAKTARELLLERRSFWSGIEFHAISDSLADVLNLPPGATGVLLKTVAKGSPADAIGLRGATMIASIGGEQVPLGGDILMTVDGIHVSTPNLVRIRDLMNAKRTGDSFKVTALRAGKVLELTGKVP
jgi:S1-C subfamily serine protease